MSVCIFFSLFFPTFCSCFARCWRFVHVISLSLSLSTPYTVIRVCATIWRYCQLNEHILYHMHDCEIRKIIKYRPTALRNRSIRAKPPNIGIWSDNDKRSRNAANERRT